MVSGCRLLNVFDFISSGLVGRLNPWHHHHRKVEQPGSVAQK
jgi:hypothetical protein